MSEKEYIDIRSLFSVNSTAVYDESSKITTLTVAKKSQAGSIAGTARLMLQHDFTFVADVYLGNDSQGADGIAIAFHRGDIGFVGTHGGGLGILGAPTGVGFELDTYWQAPEIDESGDSFGHGTAKAAHAGFVSTDNSKKILTALAPIQKIPAPDGKWRTLTIKWDARAKTLTASLQTGEQTQLWTLANPPFELDQKYTFVIGAATGYYYNEHKIGVLQFEASFSKPHIEAKDAVVKKGSSFDPLHDAQIGLKATDKVDGDITSKIKVVENNVDTSKSGAYKVVYEVVNSYREKDRKEITVTVPVVHDYWADGDAKGWKFFAGDEIKLVQDAQHALIGEWVFYADKHVALYKQIELQPGKQYKAIIAVKPKDEATIANHFVKLSLKDEPASADNRVIFSKRLSEGEVIDKGYRKLEATFTATDKDTNPLFVVENYEAGWIGSIQIVEV